MRACFSRLMAVLTLVGLVGCGAGAPQAGERGDSPVTAALTQTVTGQAPADVTVPITTAAAKPPFPVYTPKPLPTSDPTHPLFVDFYLSQHPKIAAAIVWERTYGSYVPWAQWTPEEKSALRQAFKWSWQWYLGGMNSYGGPAYPDPPVNQQAVNGESPWIRTVLDGTTAWKLYLAFVAHALAADAGGWVPYKLDAYEAKDLAVLLTSTSLMRADSNAGDYYDCDLAGGYVVSCDMTPSHPTFLFKWLKTSQMIGGSDVDTIARLVDWCRWNLSHFHGAGNLANYMYFWPYAGLIPVRMVIDGTVCTDPQSPNQQMQHWTQGCGGTSRFIANVLRAANIPVRVVVCGDGHLVPHFLGQKLYLSHGDDPYSGMSKAKPPFAAQLLLIDEVTFQAWFGAGGLKAATNVGRRSVELCIDYPPDALLALHCDDVANGRDHASSKVYKYFEMSTSYGPLQTFTVSEMEARGLWVKLGLIATNRGLCQ